MRLRLDTLSKTDLLMSPSLQEFRQEQSALEEAAKEHGAALGFTKAGQ